MTTEQIALVDRLVNFYNDNRPLYRRFLDTLNVQISDAIFDTGHPLSKLVHSVKRRLKDPEHLRDKLIRKMERSNLEGNPPFDITEENLFSRINDLAGYRILHLHTTQIGEINRHLLDLLGEGYTLLEGPIARVWDEDLRTLYREMGVEAAINTRMYSSVHYIIKPNMRTPITCEIQVRTLADEIWGEIDHQLNYPHPHPSVACRGQLRVLARVASSCSRLVDSIVATDEDWKAANPAPHQEA